METLNLEAPFAQSAEDSYTNFATVKEWKKETGQPALGYFPVYFPEEIPHALGILPVALYGASGAVALDMATAHTQSFVCSISRSVFQMALQGNLDIFDGLIFSNICDVARNLSGITKRNLEKRYVDYIHYPINNNSNYAAKYLNDEYLRVLTALEKLAEKKLENHNLTKSIRIYNERRRLQLELVELRRSKPWLLGYTEWYSIMRSGSIMPVERYMDQLKTYSTQLGAKQAKAMDRIRVAVIGNFCEQPPLMLMKVIEDAGCYIINDEGLLGSRWLGEVKEGRDPILSLAQGYVKNAEPLTVRFHPDIDKRSYISNFLRSIKADGVIFLTPKFCEPALYDYMIYKSTLDEMRLPYLHLEYEESSSSFEHARTMVETFAESILFE